MTGTAWRFVPSASHNRAREAAVDATGPSLDFFRKGMPGDIGLVQKEGDVEELASVHPVAALVAAQGCGIRSCRRACRRGCGSSYRVLRQVPNQHHALMFAMTYSSSSERVVRLSVIGGRDGKGLRDGGGAGAAPASRRRCR